MRSIAMVMLACLAAGCGKRPTCKAGDLQCLASSFSIVDFANFDDASKRDKLVSVDAAKLAAAQKASGKVTLGTPNLNMQFDHPDDGAIIMLQWKDALGCRPSFCFSHCPRGVRCGTAPRCTPGRADGQTQAATEHWVEYGSSPEASTDFDLDVVAISAPGCPLDPAAILGTSGVEGSETLVVPVHIDLGGGSGGGSTSGGSSGTSGGGTCGDGLEASTLSCTPLGSGGVADTCITPAQYQAVFGTSTLPACGPSGLTGCMDTQKGALVRPCCPGLTCKVSAQCGDASNVVGGTCL